eukprot:gene3016-3836_t
MAANKRRTTGQQDTKVNTKGHSLRQPEAEKQYTWLLKKNTRKFSKVFSSSENTEDAYKVDGSVSRHAKAARESFLRNVRRGEASMQLALAALDIAAEDDALVTNSAVALPVPQYLKRLEAFALELEAHYLSDVSEPADVFERVQYYLF